MFRMKVTIQGGGASSTYQEYRTQIDNPMSKLHRERSLNEPRVTQEKDDQQSHRYSKVVIETHMKHPNPSRIAPKVEATSSTETPNWPERRT